MEDYKKKSVVDGDKEIVFSKAIKAGKRCLLYTSPSPRD